ncbi:MAG: GspE/PulE family protein [Planctomycetota bacterium]
MRRDELEFGEDLVQRGVITKSGLEEAVQYAKSRRQDLRRSLSDAKILALEVFDQQRAEYFGIPYMNLANFHADPQALALLPEEVCRSEILVPLFQTDTSLAVAVADPTNLVAIDQVRNDTGLDIDLYYAPADAIQMALETNYASSMFALGEGAEIAVQEQDVPKIVDSLLKRAIRDGASDVHIEPGDTQLLVRQRVDGSLQEVRAFSKELQANMVSRVKILASLDISETRVPQDGNVEMNLAGEKISLRVSTTPTVHGENVVLRLLVGSKVRIGIQSLGLDDAVRDQFVQLVKRPHGMIIVTGPTGSGKTTTLYTALDLLNTVDKNIMTIEDPVEYKVDLLRQIQVNAKVGLTFASGLRSILRQDPDIVMVGEIRDPETASVAVQAALTGHLVLTTLHTNDAAGAVTRLLHMGIPPFLVASSLSGVIAQRLVRKLCTECRVPSSPPPALASLSTGGREQWYAPTGCDRCRRTGFRGRAGIHELLLVTPEIESLIVDEAPASAYEQVAIANGMVRMFDDGVRKVRQGLTTIQEVLAVTNTSLEPTRAAATVS